MENRIKCVVIDSGGGPLDMGSAVYAIPYNGMVHKIEVVNDCVGDGRLFARHLGYLDQMPSVATRVVCRAYEEIVRAELVRAEEKGK